MISTSRLFSNPQNFFLFHTELQDFAPIPYFGLTHTSISKNLVTTTGPHNLSP